MDKIVLKGYKDRDFSFYAFEIEGPDYIMCVAHGVAEDALRYTYFAQKLNEAGYSVYVINHIAHGQDYKVEELGHWEKGDFDGCIENIHVMSEYAKSLHPNAKPILFGHSMGSFIVQKYELLYPHEFKAHILCGCAYADALYKLGKMMSATVRLFKKGTARSPFMNNIAFGPFNKKFKPNKTSVDWLSANEENCIKYEQDPYCGFVCTSSFYKEFYKNVSAVPNKKYNHLYAKDYPILLIGGANDMVSNMGKRLTKLEKYYAKQSDNVKAILYPNDRHEILNEDDKDQVILDIINFVKEH